MPSPIIEVPMDKCKICNHDIEIVMRFGKMPIANGFICNIDEEEFFYDLSVGFCPVCFMVQLISTVAPKKMFNESYHFISSTSLAMAEHFKRTAEEIIVRIAGRKSPFVVELGCNDGIMLGHIADKGIMHIGVEPSVNVADLARKRGINVTNEFFDVKSAKAIVNKYGQADVICGSNVMCHIEDINSVFQGIDILLKENGILFFEDPYLLDIVKKTSFDQIYDEHVYYFSGLSVSRLAKRHNLTLANMIHQDVHGGSMRYYIIKGSVGSISESVKDFISQEELMKLNKVEGYLKFKNKVNKICNDLKAVLLRIKQEGGRIAGYGATSKSTTLLNYAGIGLKFIDYISDTTPTKIDKYAPGTHIPIKSHEFFTFDNPQYALLFAWNHKAEIFKKEEIYRRKGGRFITYFPKVIIE